MINILLIEADVNIGLKNIQDRSVQTVVTSPPYWGLRDYGSEGQLGLESTPDEYINKLVNIFQEIKRVTRKDGTAWLNLGDSYASSPKGNKEPSGLQSKNYGVGADVPMKRNVSWAECGLKSKDLVGIPWMAAFAIRNSGWYLRSDIIWNKPNPMPESITDRPTKAHEYIFMFAKASRYFYDGDAIREEYQGKDERQWAGDYDETGSIIQGSPNRGIQRTKRYSDKPGRNKRSVWSISTIPFPEAHFAVFPPKLIEPCILAGTSEKGQCPECGSPWERIMETVGHSQWGNERKRADAPGAEVSPTSVFRTGLIAEKATVGWQPTCECNHDPVPCIVLDPFNGSGTSAIVSLKNYRSYIGIDIKSEYLNMTETRLLKTHQEMGNRAPDVTLTRMKEDKIISKKKLPAGLLASGLLAK